MGDMIESAFRRAQEKAFLARRVDGLEATYDRALITAYLDDPDVAMALKVGMVLVNEDDSNDWRVRRGLQAIGAKP